MAQSLATCTQEVSVRQITAAKLAEIVALLLTNTEATGELDAASTFACFMSDIAEVVASYCGGEVAEQAALTGGAWVVDVVANDALPDGGGGVWKLIAPMGEEDGARGDIEQCTCCLADLEESQIGLCDDCQVVDGQQ